MRRRVWSLGLVLATLAMVLAPSTIRPDESIAAEQITYTFEIGIKGRVVSNVDEFAAHARATLSDPRGWSLGGSIRFVQVAQGEGMFTLWISEASLMTSFSSGCSAEYSCRVGRDVVINDDRWAGGSPHLFMALDDYRKMVVTHEVGHWLGLGHRSCAGRGQPAYVMQQQSKGGDFLGSCLPSAWPRNSEREALARDLGIPFIPFPLRLGMAATPSGQGYWIVQSDGDVYARGDAPFLGSMRGEHLNKRLVGMAPTTTGKGYWLVGEDGGIFSFGDAPFYGSTGNIVLNKPIVGMTSTPSGLGYWFVASDGGVFSYGDAQFFGSTGAITLNQPIVGMARTPTGKGYWLVASDGGIFAFGDAAFIGSLGGLQLKAGVVGMSSSPTGAGYWFTAANGGVAAYGDALFQGALTSTGMANYVVAITSTASGNGYWLLGVDGTVYPFGDAKHFGNGNDF
jgi:hypothetical protein